MSLLNATFPEPSHHHFGELPLPLHPSYLPPPPPPRPPARPPASPPQSRESASRDYARPSYSSQRAHRSTLGEPGARQTHTFHAVLDYDYEDGDTDGGVVDPGSQHLLQQTHGQQKGPILVKNGTVPVVPLYSYPALDNGTLVQIPILWTALSLALGLEIRGEVIRGVPCIKRYHQLFCPTAGNSYPIDLIERFIDENKALMKRMYGEFQMNDEYGPPAQEVFETQTSHRSGPLKRRSTEKREAPGSPGGAHPREGGADPASDQNEPPVANARFPRQSSFRGNQTRETGRVDACESKVEIVTPYWASNSAGKIRAIVNTQHFEQAIHQEVCAKVQTIRCSGDCGCEQKYKWHRLLAYDPDNDCKGIFMDWFLFPSCCVCRCSPIDGR